MKTLTLTVCLCHSLIFDVKNARLTLLMLYIITSAVGDTCVAMDEWVQHPTAHTALDEILPCVDNATAQQTLLQSRDVTRQLVILVDKIISDVTNRNLPPQAGPVYYNQSGPLMPILCNPFHPDLTVRQCETGEVPLDNATEVRHFLGNIIFRKYFLTFFLLRSLKKEKNIFLAWSLFSLFLI